MNVTLCAHATANLRRVASRSPVAVRALLTAADDLKCAWEDSGKEVVIKVYHATFFTYLHFINGIDGRTCPVEMPRGTCLQTLW